MRPIPTTLKIYWEDDVTVELRYFPSRAKALRYTKEVGITNYALENKNV